MGGRLIEAGERELRDNVTALAEVVVPTPAGARLACWPSARLAGDPSGRQSSFTVVMQHYEPIRLALLADSGDPVAAHGRAIAAELRPMQADFGHERAGVSREVAAVLSKKLPT